MKLHIRKTDGLWGIFKRRASSKPFYVCNSLYQARIMARMKYVALVTTK